MQVSSPMPESIAAAPTRGRRTVDAPTRMFHWLFALCFAGAYLTGDGERWRLVHVILGYTMAGLLVFRLLYGLFGPATVRLQVLWRKLAVVPGWLRGLAQGHLFSVAYWRQGQGVAMGATITAILLLAVPLLLSGHATYDEWGGEWLEEVHEFLANVSLLLVLAHLGLLLGLSLLRRRNLAWPMLTGRVEGRGPDLVKKNRGWLAALLLLAVLAFGWWQWQQAPVSVPGSGPRAGALHDDVEGGDD